MKEMVHREVSEWIKQLRVAAGLSIKDASHLLDCDQSCLEELENGKSIPLQALTRICVAYGASPEELENKIIELQKFIMGKSPYRKM
jgi:transcriptional regulator with XRE-family HTH domain